MKNLLFTLMFFFGLTLVGNAQQTKPAYKFTNDFLSFFIGSWSGEGEFANGKKIAADLTFKLTLDSAWISYEHTDKLPNKYKALSMWGIDRRSGEFIAYTFGNSGSHQKFLSDGWINNKLILTANNILPQGGTFYQHFIYEKQNEITFKMTYETSKDGTTWKMVDYLIFKKTSN